MSLHPSRPPTAMLTTRTATSTRPSSWLTSKTYTILCLEPYSHAGLALPLPILSTLLHSLNCTVLVTLVTLVVCTGYRYWSDGPGAPSLSPLCSTRHQSLTWRGQVTDTGRTAGESDPVSRDYRSPPFEPARSHPAPTGSLGTRSEAIPPPFPQAGTSVHCARPYEQMLSHGNICMDNCFVVKSLMHTCSPWAPPG